MVYKEKLADGSEIFKVYCDNCGEKLGEIQKGHRLINYDLSDYNCKFKLDFDDTNTLVPKRENQNLCKNCARILSNMVVGLFKSFNIELEYRGGYYGN